MRKVDESHSVEVGGCGAAGRGGGASGEFFRSNMTFSVFLDCCRRFAVFTYLLFNVYVLGLLS